MRIRHDRIRSIVFSPGILVVIFGLGIGYANRNAFFSVNDSFITYRYAINLLQGNGLVFNVGESYYGTTAAGYAILLALLAKPLFLVFPQLTIQNVSVGVSALSLMLISACCWVMIPHGRVRSIDAITVWLIFVVMAFVAEPFNGAAGHETYAFLALAFSACVLAAKQKMVASAMFLGLAATLRPDAVLMAPIIVVASIVFLRIPLSQSFRDRRLLIFSGAFMAVLVPWLVYLQLHFGRAFPGTMDAKRAQVAMGYWPLYRPVVMADYVFTALTAPTLAVLGFGVAVFAWLWQGSLRTAEAPKETLTPVFYVGTCWLFFLVLSTAFYFAINVTFWRWYGIPVVFSLFVVAYSGWVSALASDDRTGVEGWRSARTLVVLVVGAVFASLTFDMVNYWFRNPQVNQHIYAYHEVADKLKALYPDGAVVAMAEPGAFAVRLGPKFKVVDELGLISPGVAKAYLRGDPNYVYREFKPKYLVCSWKGAYSGCDKPEVIKSYRLIGEFDRGFWYQHIGSGAKLFKLEDAPVRSALGVGISAIDLVKDVRLGDTWGKVERGGGGELFIHPGANSDTSFTLVCENDCAGLIIDARIADLPREAPENSGSVRMTVLTNNREKIYDEVLVDRAHPFHGKLKVGTYRIEIGNNGDPSYDWFVLRLSHG